MSSSTTMKKKSEASSSFVAPRSSSSPVSSFRIREYDEDPSINTGTAWREFIIQKDGSREIAALSTYKAAVIAKVCRWLRAPMSVAKDLFLPIGYPATVRTGYLEYQIYDSIQGLCSYLRSVLCSAQVLQAAGVGNEQATAMGAALAWAQKDGAAMIGGLIFSYLASPQFDGHVKEFRLFADIINDAAMTLDMLTPYFVYGDYFGTSSSSSSDISMRRLLYISSVSTLCKTMCGMSAGATKASITQYFAIEGNMADLNATESTQETLMSLIGMLLGATLASYLSEYENNHQSLSSSTSQHSQNSSHNMTIQWTVFTLLTLIHVWANYKGVALLRLLTLNRERTEVILKSIIQHQQHQQQNHPINVLLDNNNNNHNKDKNKSNNSSRHNREEDEEHTWIQQHYIQKPSEVYESMWSSTCKMLWPNRHFQLNTHRLTDLIALDSTVLDQLLDNNDNNNNNRYVLILVGNGPWNQRQILVCLLTGANNQDELQAFCHAYYLRHVLLTTTSLNGNRNGGSILPTTTSTTTSIMAQNRALVQAAGKAIEPWFKTNKMKNNHVLNNGGHHDDDDDEEEENTGPASGSNSTSCNPSHYGLLMRVLVRQGWDVHNLYLGFSRRRSQWSRTKEE